MTEEQFKQALWDAVGIATISSMTSQDVETQEMLDVLQEVLPGTDAKDLYKAIMQREDPLHSPEEIEAKLQELESVETDDQFEEINLDFLEMCVENLDDENPLIDTNPSLHDPER